MTTQSIESSKPKKNKIYKILGILLGIYLLYSGIFYGVLNYELKNNCTVKFKDSFPFLTCQPVRPPIGLGGGCSGICPAKPLILLYPKTEMPVKVELQYAPGFFATYPKYSEKITGWEVIAKPDGTLFDTGTQQETYGLFWEGNSGEKNYDMSKGFVVEGKNIREFLSKKLTEIGLNTKERSDFIMFWYPKLQHYKYVQITFAGDGYVSQAPLKITPKPDSLLRVFMVAQPLEKNIVIPEQKIEKFERKGFSVVEWGGTIME